MLKTTVKLTVFHQLWHLYQKGNIPAFKQDQKGVFALSFMIIFPALIACIALTSEATHYIAKKARLSDALEQAAIALTVEDNQKNNGNNPRNKALVTEYIQAYMPSVVIKPGSIAISMNNKNLGKDFVSYSVSAQINQDSWFASRLLPNFGPQVGIGSSAVAQKSRAQTSEVMDVVFVADFSSSMKKELPGKETRLAALKRVMLKLFDQIHARNSKNTIGFVPFSVGTKMPGNGECTIQFVSGIGINTLDRIRMPDGEKYNNYSLAHQRALENYLSVYFNSPDNIRATVNGIPKPVNPGEGVYIPIKELKGVIPQGVEKNKNKTKDEDGEYGKYDERYGLCPLASNYDTFELTSDVNMIKNKINAMDLGGNTFIVSAMVHGAQILSQGTATDKRLVLISDGEDTVFQRTSNKLVKGGLCNAIKDKNISIEFIGIGYMEESKERISEIQSKESFLKRNTLPTDEIAKINAEINELKKSQELFEETRIDWETECAGPGHFYTADTAGQLEQDLVKATLPVEEVGRNTPK